jgi:hypothetical protein
MQLNLLEPSVSGKSLLSTKVSFRRPCVYDSCCFCHHVLTSVDMAGHPKLAIQPTTADVFCFQAVMHTLYLRVKADAAVCARYPACNHSYDRVSYRAVS